MWAGWAPLIANLGVFVELRLALVGQLDLSYTGQLRAILDDALASGDDIRVDLSEVRTVDSTGIRELLRAQARAARAGKAFSVVATSPGVRRLLLAADAAGLLFEDESPPTRQLCDDGVGDAGSEPFPVA